MKIIFNMKNFFIYFIISIAVLLSACDPDPNNSNGVTPELTPPQSSAPTDANMVDSEKISTFETVLVDKQKDRLENVLLASSACNGTIIRPGEEFSFNETVGERTTKRGYKKAYIFVGKKKEKGVGGGICQVSSTIYNAALDADLEVTERHEHSQKVTYIELGKDATVSDSLDLKFKNTLDYAVKMEVTATEGYVAVNMYKI